MLLKKRTNPAQRSKKGKTPAEVAKDPAVAELLQAAEAAYAAREGGGGSVRGAGFRVPGV
jgi:hypothetical protein